MNRTDAGFSLVEVVVGVAITAIAVACIAAVSTQLARMSNDSAARMRVNTTVQNIATDLRALLRYDGPAAQALEAGANTSSFTVSQWEPDLAQAPVACTMQHLTTPPELHLVCSDRRGIQASSDVDLTGSQPAPASTVTAAPT